MDVDSRSDTDVGQETDTRSETHRLLGLALVVAGTGFCLVGANNTLNAYTATLYPTDIRSTAVGWGSSFGRFVGGLGPFFGGILLHELPLDTVFFIFAVPAICGALAVLALQRSRLTPPQLFSAKAGAGI